MFNKYQFIEGIVIQMDKILDQRGVERAATIIDIINKLTALKDGLKKEDEAVDKELEELRKAVGVERIPVDEFFGNDGDNS